jgi:hypothetical protein
MKRKKDIKVKVTIILIFFRLISHEKKEQMWKKVHLYIFS